MELFHVIEEAFAIICSRGIYKQTKVFRRGKDIYAGTSGGFLKLYNSSATSHPRISWHGVEGEGIGYDSCKAPKWLGVEIKIEEKTNGTPICESGHGEKRNPVRRKVLSRKAG